MLAAIEWFEKASARGSKSSPRSIRHDRYNNDNNNDNNNNSVKNYNKMKYTKTQIINTQSIREAAETKTERERGGEASRIWRDGEGKP